MRRESIAPDAHFTHRVTDADTAWQWGNELPVLATPVLLWLAEIAAMRATERALDEGEMTVGVGHDCEHLAPTPCGGVVRVTARLLDVDGRRLAFAVEARDGNDLVFRGTHTRGVVDRERFLARLRQTAGGAR